MDYNYSSIDIHKFNINNLINTDISNKKTSDFLYLIELILFDNVLQIKFGLTDEADKYKNNFTLNKIIYKEPKISYFYINIKSLKDDLFEMIKSNNYRMKLYDEYNLVILTFNFDKFKNKKHNFRLDFSLYKTDCKHASTLVNQLTNELEQIEKDNKVLNGKQEEVFNKLKIIQNDNIITLNDLDSIYDFNKNLIKNRLLDIKESTILRIKQIDTSFNSIKTDLINYGESININNKYMYVYLPILRTEDKKLLYSWFEKDYDLIPTFNSIKDGDSSKAFHEKCKGKVNTLIVIESDKGKRFGGYSKLTWDPIEEFKGNDESAFLFSLDNKIKFNLNTNSNDKVIYTSVSNGPKYGIHDISICDAFHSSNKSYSKIFNSYGCVESLNTLTNKDLFNTTSILAGSEYFKVNRLEVFQVIFK